MIWISLKLKLCSQKGIGAEFASEQSLHQRKARKHPRVTDLSPACSILCPKWTEEEKIVLQEFHPLLWRTAAVAVCPLLRNTTAKPNCATSSFQQPWGVQFSEGIETSLFTSPSQKYNSQPSWERRALRLSRYGVPLALPDLVLPLLKRPQGSTGSFTAMASAWRGLSPTALLKHKPMERTGSAFSPRSVPAASWRAVLFVIPIKVFPPQRRFGQGWNVGSPAPGFFFLLLRGNAETLKTKTQARLFIIITIYMNNYIYTNIYY